MTRKKKVPSNAKKTGRPWKISVIPGGVVNIKHGTRTWVYISSDWHWDSVHCDRDRLAADLTLAKKVNAPVLCLGDLFDVMGGKYDPRSNGKYDIRPELQTGDYFDLCVSECAKWLKPWMSQIALITPGNHETSVRKRMETCLTTRLVERLKIMGSPCVQSGYAGWLLFTLAMSGGARVTNSLYWHHGFGGGGPITKGAIDYSRYLLDVDADIIAAGHVHQRMCIEASRQRLSPRGIPRVSPVFLIRSASYKQECLTDGWAVEKGMSSRPLGGYWMMIRQTSNKDGSVISIHDHPEV